MPISKERNFAKKKLHFTRKKLLKCKPYSHPLDQYTHLTNVYRSIYGPFINDTFIIFIAGCLKHRYRRGGERPLRPVGEGEGYNIAPHISLIKESTWEPMIYIFLKYIDTDVFMVLFMVRAAHLKKWGCTQLSRFGKISF